MSAIKPKTFRVTLEAMGMGLSFVVARIPGDLKKAWPEWKTRRVHGEINGFAFSTNLFPGPKGVGNTLVVNKNMQAGARVRAGQKVQIQLEPDLEAKPFAVPQELARALKQDKQVWRWFERLSPSMRKGVGLFVDQAKGAETRKKRAEQMAETIMLAMEGEVELPPILRAAFQRQPLAHDGWNAMTPTQRRNHLLGIFYAQTVDGRERRVVWTVDAALKVARRKIPGAQQRHRFDEEPFD